MGANCATSTTLGCYFCYSRCQVEKIRNAFTFIPPPSSYSVDETDSKGQGAKLVYTIEQLTNVSVYRLAAEEGKVSFVNTSRGERVPLVMLRQDSHAPQRGQTTTTTAASAPLVILHCHGNATDIGLMMASYYELVRRLRVDVVGVEYTGYGISSGSPSTGNTLCDVEAAYDHLLSTGVNATRIVAYGQSVGSGPVCSLASKRELGGIVLHSPLLSGIKVLDPVPDGCCKPSCIYHPCDFYPNESCIRKVRCPVFVMHGKSDDVVKFHHGFRVHESTPEPFRWPGYFPANAGHNNILESNASAYFAMLRSFLEFVKNRRPGESVPLKRPSQVEMTAQSDTQLAFREPKVGPDDGRYKQMRGEGEGQARELQLPTARVAKEDFGNSDFLLCSKFDAQVSDA